MIHALATPEGRDYSKDNLLHWHMLPAVVPGGLKYKSKIYPDAESLPDEYIGGLSVRKYRGDRGWSRPGYEKMILLNGVVQTVWNNNDDDIVDDFEITNGILASDLLYRVTRHIVYVGGMDSTNTIPKDTRTQNQLQSLTYECFRMVEFNPEIKIIGHNQINNRACPSFNVPEWCRAIGIEEKNIDNRPLMFQL